MKTFNVTEQNRTEAIEAIANDIRQLENLYELVDDEIDEVYDPVEIGVCKFSPSRVLKELDPIAYEMWVDDFIEQKSEDLYYELAYGYTTEIEIFDYIFKGEKVSD